MRVVRLTVVGCLFVALAGCGSSTTSHKGAAQNDQTGSQNKPASNKDMIVGVWEVTHGDMPQGSTIEFTKDGKMKMTIKAGDKTVISEGTYVVEGDSIKAAHKVGPRDVKETVKITTLTETELVTTDEKGKVDHFKKK